MMHSDHVSEKTRLIGEGSSCNNTSSVVDRGESSIQNGGIGADESIEATNQNLSNCYKLVKTIALIYAWFVMGFSDMLLSACLLDLKELFKVSYQELANAYALRAVGLVVGSLLSAVLGDKLRRYSNLLLACSFLLLGGCLAATIYSPNITIATIFIVGIGMSYNITNGLGFPMCVNLWKKSTAAPLQLMMAAHSVGQLISPLVSEPFLSKRISQGNGIPLISNGTIDLHNSAETETKSHVQIPFIISAGSSVLCVVCFFIFHAKEARVTTIRQQQDTKSFWEYFKEEKSQGRLCYLVCILALVPISFTFSSGRDVSTTRYILPLAVNSGLFSKSEALTVLLIYNISAMLCRFSAALLLKFVPLKYVLFVPAFSSVIFVGSLYSVGFESRTSFWILICLSVFSYRTFRGSMVAWLNIYILFTPFVMAFADLGIGAGSTIFNWLCGGFLDDCGPTCVVMACFVASCSLCAIITVAQAIASLKLQHEEGHKMTNQQDSINR